MAIDEHTKRWLRRFGQLLSAAGVVFVIVRLADHGMDIRPDWFTPVSIAVWIALAGVYAGANALLVVGWRALLRHFRIGASWDWSLRVFGVSQLAKYVPGNVVHLAGRQAMGVADGVDGWALAKSAAWELGLLALAAATFAALALPAAVGRLSLNASLFGFIVLVGAVHLVLRRAGPGLALAFVAYVLFFAVAGGIFLALFAVPEGVAVADTGVALHIGSAFVVAWLAGFVTPGAPAGVGVREAVLIYLLQGMATQPEILLATLVSRLVTVSGDLLFFAAALYLSRGGEGP